MATTHRFGIWFSRWNHHWRDCRGGKGFKPKLTWVLSGIARCQPVTIFAMNPDYLWLTGALQLLTFFVVGPVLAIAIAYTVWREKPQNFNSRRYATLCAMSGAIAFLLFAFAKWLNADARTPQYFLQLASFLLSGLLFGMFMGCGFSMLLGVLRWHRATRLRDGRTQR